MTRRTVTLLTGFVLVAVLGALGGAVQVPFVALGPGPTFNIIGEVDGAPVVDIKGVQTYPTSGNLNMTTVSVQDGVTLFGAVGLWLNGREALVPRETVYPQDQTTQQVERQNTADFQGSESSAVAAALGYLKYPFRITVAQLSEASPAAGVLQPGDQITSVGGTAITTATGVRDALAGSKPGQTVALGFTRSGNPATSSVVLGSFPDGQQQGFLGVSTSANPDVPFTVKISLQNVGGPSAGLMFALGVVDKLTTGDLNHGAFVAGTGTIDAAGTVGPIGGIPFKLVAAKEAGASTFLVPAQNCAEAVANAPDGLRLVKVDTLPGAVSELGTLASGGDVPSC